MFLCGCSHNADIHMVIASLTLALLGLLLAFEFVAEVRSKASLTHVITETSRNLVSTCVFD